MTIYFTILDDFVDNFQLHLKVKDCEREKKKNYMFVPVSLKELSEKYIPTVYHAALYRWCSLPLTSVLT